MEYLPARREALAASDRCGYRPFGAFRFGLAMMVLAQHSLVLLPASARTVFYTLELGAVAVSCFFALSGFIVAEALSRFYAGRPFAFLANRILRVVPPYLAALALAITAESLLYATGRLLPLDAPLQGAPWQGRVVFAAICEIIPCLPTWRLSGQAFSFIPFAWTLRIEFLFYLLAFLACWLRRRTSGPMGRAVLPAVLAAAYGAFLLFLWRHGQAPLQLLTVPFFAFGLCCFAYRRRPDRGARLHLAAVAAAVPLAFTFWGQHGHPEPAYQLPWLCCLCLLLFWLSGVVGVPDWLRNWDRRLGELSYPLYIGHGIVLVLLSSLAGPRGWLLYAAGIAASLVLAIALHAAVERPMRHLRDRVRGTQIAS
jgi:peptidoglycan/LPS O-acetylase OafA/YrhL